MEREGFRNEAYPDPATGGDPWTIGVGHTGPEVHPGLYWSDDEVAAALQRDLLVYESAINGAVQVDLEQHQFDALVSFAFNVGTAGAAGSEALRALNVGDYQGAAAKLMNWNRPAMIISRRRAEMLQFLGEQFVARAD